MDQSCPHLSLVLKVSKEDLLIRSEKPCQVCRKREKLWACLQANCQFVGCGEKVHDHSTKHYTQHKHAIAVNLNSFRIWCFACEKEVYLPSAFTPLEMKSLKKSKKMRKENVGRPNATNDLPQSPRESQPVSTEAYHTEMNSPPVGLTGLRNMGNTCYMNSALQAISNCPPVTQYFAHCDNGIYPDKRSMAWNYVHLMHDMWSEHRYPCIAPTGVHSTLKAINPSFRGYHQQDAQEFLRCFMDRLHEELKLIVPKWTYDDEIRDEEEATNTEEEPMEVDDDEENPSPMPSARVPDSEPDSIGSFRIVSESQPSSQRSGKVSSSPGSSRSHNFSQLHGAESSANENNQNKEQRSKVRTSKNKLKYQNQQIRPSKKPDYRFHSIVSDIFDGELRSSVQCLTCDQVSHTRETFQDLSLPIPGKDDLTRLHSMTGSQPVAASSGSLAVIPGFKGPCSENTPSWTGGLYYYAWDVLEWLKNWFWGPQVTLNDCLSAFFSADELKGDNMYSCNKCNKLRNGMKYCKLLQLPEVLCIHLKRFRHEYLTSYSSKISSPVTFPIKGLDLRQYLAQDSPSTCTTYDLCSIIVHHGNAGGGHYTAYAKNMMDNEWYEFDDQFITKVPESVVSNAEAYVLFYQKSSAEASRARQRILQTYNTDENRQESSKDLLQFFISISWLNKFITFNEPGPIDNSDFLCRHSGILPMVKDELDLLAQSVSEPFWKKLHERYGGGPAVTTLMKCEICEEEHNIMRQRREEERCTFLKISEAEVELQSPTAQVYISLEWFREWEDFLNGKLPEPPGKIDNWPICYVKEGKHILRKSSSHAPIPREAWDYLISIYGGRPEVAPLIRGTSKSPNRKMKSPRASSPSPPTPMEQDKDVKEKVEPNPTQEGMQTSSQEIIKTGCEDDGSDLTEPQGPQAAANQENVREEDIATSSEETIVASPSCPQDGGTLDPDSLEEKQGC